MIVFPARPGDAVTLRLRLPSDHHRIGMNWVYVDPSTAQVLRVDRFDQQPLGVKIIRLITPLHYGTIGGLPTRILWVAAGLMPGVFFVTALVMWWNRVLSKAAPEQGDRSGLRKPHDRWPSRKSPRGVGGLSR